MTPKQFDRLPQVFKDKIIADENLADARMDNILNFTGMSNLLRLQRVARRKCISYLKKDDSSTNNNRI